MEIIRDLLPTKSFIESKDMSIEQRKNVGRSKWADASQWGQLLCCKRKNMSRSHHVDIATCILNWGQTAQASVPWDLQLLRVLDSTLWVWCRNCRQERSCCLHFRALGLCMVMLGHHRFTCMPAPLFWTRRIRQETPSPLSKMTSWGPCRSSSTLSRSSPSSSTASLFSKPTTKDKVSKNLHGDLNYSEVHVGDKQQGSCFTIIRAGRKIQAILLPWDGERNFRIRVYLE